MQSIALLVDCVVLTVAYVGASLLRSFHSSIPLLRELEVFPAAQDRVVSAEYALFLLVNLLAWVAYVKRSQIYTSGRSESILSYGVVYAKAVTLQVFVTGALVFVLKIALSRLLFGYFFVAAFLLLVAKQAVVNTQVRRVRAASPYRRHALIIGSLRPAAWFSAVLEQSSSTGHQLQGVLLMRPATPEQTGGLPVLGTLDDLNNVLRDYPIEEVFLVGAARELAELAPVAQGLIERGRVVSLVTAISTTEAGVRGRITDFNGVPMISYGPMPRDEVKSQARRMIDIVGSAMLMLAASPFMLGVAALIKIFDPGPIFFGHERLGLGGERFRCFKFRSMRVDAEKILRQDKQLWDRYVANDFKLPEDEDPRISRLGRLLRRTSLDELPQLWNVLRGDMTLVGPRPIVPDELQNYEPYGDLFLSVKPGLTGRWQVSGRSDVKGVQRAFMDLDYIGDNSVMTDLAIIARTIPEVLKRTGAH